MLSPPHPRPSRANRRTFAETDERRSSMRIRLLVLPADPALAIAGTASNSISKR
jgi:hypothetical protein